ncbi:MAG TPA: hypothetical protein PKA77_14930 [Chitinophagaceae bacterium]|jgi:hypothetical protein|nr:hypothetical protein [Chitinophagaceae bacterium]HMU58205.1 hypothetical protein [Chitinophagaceae bacterium]
MKGWLAALACFFSISFFVSCQKEVDEAIISTRPVHSSEGTILEAYILLDTTEQIGIDTFSVRKYYYDSQGRVNKITEKWFQRGTPVVSSFSEEVRSYTGNDSSPILTSTKTTLDNGVILTDTVFLSYYADYIVKKDSIRQYINSVLQSTSSFSYTKLDNVTYHISGSAYEVGNLIPTNEVTLKNYFVNGNLNSKYDSVYRQIATTTNYAITKLDCQYDASNNPFRNITLRYPDIGEGFGGYTKNNPTRWDKVYYTSTSAIPQNSSVSVVYTYNSYGYPITIDVSNSPTPFQTYLFYRN